MTAARKIFAVARFGDPGSAPLYARIKKLVQQAVSGGELKHGDSVPSERDVADIHAISETLLRGIPRARKVVLPRVGHMANMEAPGPFNEVVLNFLASSQ